ncbi:MAG: hypothetical protein ACP5VP_10350 [Candidatus Limnocylindrales bacterium]
MHTLLSGPAEPPEPPHHPDLPEPDALAAPVYAPGACNIGPAEVAQRRRAAVGATAATVVFAGLLVVGGAPRKTRALVGVPAALTTVAWLQVRNRFCVAYAARGVYNVAQPLGHVTVVNEALARRADRRRAAWMYAQGLAVGLAVAAALSLLP